MTKKKIMVSLASFFFFLTTLSLVFAQKEITLTTFYPSPAGVYRVIEFHPSSPPSEESQGQVYYDSHQQALKVYDGSQWQDVGVPQGTIVMWSGSAANIPAGWALCDGTNGTPDLRDRFIVGAGGSYLVGSRGGSATHTHGIGPISIE